MHGSVSAMLHWPAQYSVPTVVVLAFASPVTRVSCMVVDLSWTVRCSGVLG